jgi:L-serine dehydratase
MGGDIQRAVIEFHPDGSLATTHATQGSDMGLFAGLLGLSADDEKLVDSAELIKASGIDVSVKITDFPADHPNTYKITLANSSSEHTMIAISTGGGGITISEIDDFRMSIAGDYYETLIFHHDNPANFTAFLNSSGYADQVLNFEKRKSHLIEVKSQAELPPQFISEVRTKFRVNDIIQFTPVLPILSGHQKNVPFNDIPTLLAFNESRSLPLWELAVIYESARGNISSKEVFAKMEHIVTIMRNSIESGIEGTSYPNRILGYQSGNFRRKMEKGALLDGGMLNRMTLYVSAIMEQKSSMGVIVAAPTAGACGALPGACLGAADEMGAGNEAILKAMLAAGLIGVFIADYSTFAAEIAGCQAECGAGSGMAAAALVSLKNGSVSQHLNAVSLALQNIFGLTCDPVANRVEVPCLGKNAMAAANALSCANMALADYDPVIPLDEVLQAMDSVGKSLPHELRCTALGGLSITKTSKEIEQRLNNSQ